jgi:hypothetical protein
MDPRLYEADGCCQWHVLRHNGADASGSQADGTRVGIHRFLVDDAATLPIFTEEATARIATLLVGGSRVWPCQK